MTTKQSAYIRTLTVAEYDSFIEIVQAAVPRRKLFRTVFIASLKWEPFLVHDRMDGVTRSSLFGFRTNDTDHAETARSALLEAGHRMRRMKMGQPPLGDVAWRFVFFSGDVMPPGSKMAEVKEWHRTPWAW